ncbi:MAG TPA: DUF5941 domain-containing protein [Streptosporangiaceae bacterium]
MTADAGNIDAGNTDAGNTDAGNHAVRARAADAVAYHGGRLIAYRDDGWPARLLGRVLGRAARGWPPLAPALVAAASTVVLIVAGTGERADLMLFAPVVALLLAGPAAGHPHGGRLDWLVPPVIRVTEYGYLAALGFARDVPDPMIYVLIAVLAYHHYDIVYRTRQKLWPRDWVFRAGLGWDGRMLVAAASAFAGIATFAYAALAAYLGVLFGVESVLAWARTERGEGVMVNLEEEEEAGS